MGFRGGGVYFLVFKYPSRDRVKRLLHYTRCTMTESRLNDLALIALHPIRLSELSTEKIIEMFVQAENCSLKELVNL